MKTKPKIILWDLETSLSVMASFGIFNVNIPYDHILEEWYIICGSWKELGKKKVHAVSVMNDRARFRENPHDDYHVVKTLHDVLSDADVLVAHNGDKFDVKKFNTRALYHGLPPLPKIKTVDTLKAARKYFKFTSNRLDYVAQYLDVGAKVETSKGLWLKTLRGDKDAIREMVEYNKVDVDVLEAVYRKMEPWIQETLNLNLFTDQIVCRSCGGGDLQARGFAYTKSGKYRRYQCNDCHSWSQGKTNLKKVDLR